MTFSTRGRYALRLMLDLAQHGHLGWVSLKETAARQEISAKYLEQIVTPLVREGLLVTLRGAQGGYRLSKPPTEITAYDVLKASGTNTEPVKCLEAMDCHRRPQCLTVGFWAELSRLNREFMQSVTLQDLLSQKFRDNPDPMDFAAL